MVSRAGDPAFWDDGDVIRVRIGSYPWTGKYALNTDGSVKKSIDALAWPHPDDFVSAWYPFLDEGAEVSINDQSKGYHKFDFLEAHTDRMMNYKEIVNLNFYHQMAKVRCELIKGDGVTEDDLKTVKVSYFGFPTVVFSEQGISGKGSNEYITSAADYSALLVPQDMSGKPFIKVDLTVTVNNVPVPKTLVYTPQETMNLVAGKAYTFTIKVQKDRLEVQTISGAWKETLENTKPKPDIYHIYLSEDTEGLGDLEFSSNVTEKSADTRAGSVRYLEVLGDYFTISFKATTDNCHLGIVFANKETLNEVKRTYYEKQNSVNDGYYEFSYKIVSPISDAVYLKKGEHIEIGDILFQDGKWGSIAKKIYEGEKTPVAIVFKVGAGSVNNNPPDVPTYYGWSENREIRGYAVALKDASNVSVIWGSSTQIFKKDVHIENYYSGLYITNRLKEIIPTKKLTISNFPAFQKVEEYKDITAAPEGTSGWYLPSDQQLVDIYPLFVHPQRRQWIPNAGGDFFTAGGYWSSTEISSTTARAESLNYASSSQLGSKPKPTKYYVRAVLTF